MLKSVQARRLITATGELEYPRLWIEDGRIARIESGDPNESTETLSAGFFDIHVHGACSYDFMTADAEGITAVGRYLARQGVTQYLATTVTGPVDATLRALDRLADAIERGQHQAEDAALPIGIHLEGPFLSCAKRGVHPQADLQQPSIELFDRMQQAARGHVRLMTIAPELPSALDLIAHATSTGVRVSIGHSNATAAEAQAAIIAGATSATHLFNAMRPLDHREPGVLGAMLDATDVYAEAICDGVHVHPAMLRMWLKMKGEHHAILVTDGTSATGMPDGTYKLGEFDVEVKNGVCLADGKLAGSVLTMDTAVSNVQRFTGVSLASAVRLASGNPARMMGTSGAVEITVGSAANFNIFDAQGKRTGSILRGRKIDRL